MLKKLSSALPYACKEVGRAISRRTGTTLVTPSIYYLVFGGRCNLACTFCTAHKKTDPTLARDDVLRVIREAKELSGSGFSISMSGGEPLIYEPLFDALAVSNKLGVNFGFTTNGLALTAHNVQRVVASDPFNVNVSIESVDKNINESLRPAINGTKATMTGIDRLIAEKHRTKSRVSIFVKPTIMEQNYVGLPKLVRHFGKQGVQIALQPYLGQGTDLFWVKDLVRMQEVMDELKSLRNEGYAIVGDDKTFDGFVDYMRNPPIQGQTRVLDLGGRKRNCDIGLRSMFIRPTGDVELCDFLKRPIGNIREGSLRALYRGPTAQQQRRYMVTCNIDCQLTCNRPTSLLVKARTFLRMG